MTITVVTQRPINAANAQSPSTPPDSSPGWHFPGPSSKYHTRERAKTHSRCNSGITLSVGPSLQTERRAHRRAHSSYTVPPSGESDQSHSAQRFFNVHSRRPYNFTSPSQSRSPLSRFSSFGSTNSAMMNEHDALATPSKPASTNAAILNEHDLLSTPAKPASISRQNSMLPESPFSDYCTDESRSLDGSSQALSPADSQQLLVRLHKLQSAIMRAGHDSQALNIVDRRMQEIEKDVECLHELDASGMFHQDAPRNEKNGSAHEEGTDDDLLDKIAPHFENLGTADKEHDKQKEDYDDVLSDKDKLLLRQAQDVLASLTRSNYELQQRLSEVRAHRFEHSTELDDKDAVISALRTQVSQMRADRDADRSALLTYRSHILHFINQAKELPAPVALDLTNGLRSITKDWHDTIKHMDTRRDGFEALAAGTTFDSIPASQPRWRTSLVYGEDGRMRCLTIQRAVPPTTDYQESNLLRYIDSVEDVIRDAASPPQYISTGVQTKVTHHSDWTYPASTLSSLSCSSDSEQDVVVNAYDDDNDNDIEVYIRKRSTFVGSADDISDDDANVEAYLRKRSTFVGSDDDNSDGEADIEAYLRKRPELVRPDGYDDDTHSCAITTSPASAADPAEFQTGAMTRIMNLVSGLLDEDADDEADESKGVCRAEAAIQPQGRDYTSGDFWQDLMQLTGLER